MNKLLPLLLLIPFMGNGQKTLTSKDTLTLPVDLSGTLAIGTWPATTGTVITYPTLTKPKPDTTYTRCVIWYADTARKYSVWESFEIDTAATRKNSDTATGYSQYMLYGKTVYDTTFYQPDYKTYWQPGYIVKEYIGQYYTTLGNDDLLPRDRNGFYNIIGYLNQDKSPMRKSVVVWMVKEIE